MRGTIKRNSIKRSLLMTIILLLFSLPVLGDIGDAALPVQEVYASPSTAPASPGQYMTDQDPGTYWGFNPDSSQGWAELSLDEPALIYGLKLSAAVAADNQLVVEFLKGNSWIPFAAGFLKGFQGESEFIDLSSDQAVTNRLRVRITGGNIEQSRIYELALLGKKAQTVLHKIAVKELEADENTSWYAQEENLTDGNPWTSWQILPSRFFKKDINKILKGYLKNRGKHFDHSLEDVFEQDLERFDKERKKCPKVDFTGEVEFKLKGSYSLESIRVYFGQDAAGQVELSYWTGTSWQPLDLIQAQDHNGWYVKTLDPQAVQTTKIKLVQKGRARELGGIGEVEIWGYGDYSGTRYQPLALPIAGSTAADVNLTFALPETENEERTNPQSIQIITEKSGSPLKIEFNGKEYLCSNPLQLGQSSLYRYEIPLQEYWEEENFIRILSQEEPLDIYSVRLQDQSAYGIQELIAGSLGDGLLFSSQELATAAVYEFDRTIYLKQVEIYSLTATPLSVQVELTDKSWVDLAPTGEEAGCQIYGADLLIQGLKVLPGASGLSGEIRILGSPTTDQPPQVRILLPKHNQELKNRYLKSGFVLGFVDNPQAQVDVNGRATRREGSYFWTRLKELTVDESGVLTITATARDQQGRSGSHTIQVYVGGPILLRLNLPEEVTYTRESSLKVSGRLVPYKKKILKINDVAVAVNKKGFSTTVDLHEGLNLIKVVVLDTKKARVLKTVFRKVVRVTTEVELAIDSPKNGSYVNRGEIVITGRVYSLSPELSVEVNGQEAELTNGYFKSESVSLSEGANSISIVAKDEYGGEATKTLLIYKDSVAPVLDLTTPSDGRILASSLVHFLGQVAESNQVWVFVNRVNATVSGSQYQLDLDFVDGFHPVEISAVDVAGNRAAPITLTIIVDTTPPEPFDIASNAEVWVNNPTPTITFTTTDATSGLDHYELALDEGLFTVVLSPYLMPHVEDGEHTITVHAIDKAGWVRVSIARIYIDTTPPHIPEFFRAVPGNGEITLKWKKPDEDVIKYRISRAPQWSEQFAYTEGEEYLDPGLENGAAYKYLIWAIDRAYNESPVGVVEQAISGLSVTPYEPDQGAVVEYEDVTLVVPKESLPQEVKKITVTEIESADLKERAFYPFASPIYDFSAVVEKDGQTYTRDHLAFSENFICTIPYDEDKLPGYFLEQNLGVYYFDEVWSRWFKVPNSAVDTEKNLILFSTNHFSAFSVQPTMMEDLSPQEIQDVQFSPMNSAVKHDGVTVSPQGGSATTQMTELVLPGKNGFDFTLKRTYDSATARGDSPGLGINAQLKIGIPNPKESMDLALMFTGGFNLPGQIQSMVKKYFQSNGDYSYSMGIGWRLNLPYIRGTNGSVLVRLPSGSFYSVNQMEVKKQFDIALGRVLLLENHEREDFTLKVVQVRADIDVVSLVGKQKFIPGWQLLFAQLVLKDGSVYQFDPLGRLLWFTDPSGKNKIELTYSGLLLDHITDSVGRKIHFGYTGDYLLPKISSIWVESDSPYNRRIDYTLQSVPTPGWSILMPLLVGATDVGGREYHYSYKEYFLFAGGGSVKVNFVKLIAAAVTGGASAVILGDIGLTLSANIQTEWVFPLETMAGPGLGYTTLANDNKALVYSEVEAADYFLGFIPTAVEFSVQVLQRMFVDRVDLYAYKGGPRISRHTYQYDLRYQGYQQFVNKHTIEQDGRLETDYFYDTTVKRRNRYITWSDWAADVVSGMGFTSSPYTYDVVPYNTQIEKKVQSSKLSLESVAMEYYLGSMRIKKQRVTRGPLNYTETNYTYDNWGNTTYTKNYSRTGERINQSQTWSYFYNTNSQKASGVPWLSNPYAPHPDGIYKNLLAGSVTKNYLPAEAENGAALFLRTYKNYDNATGLLTGEAKWTGTQWARTSYQRHPVHGSITRVEKPNGHVTTINYDYSPATAFYITTTEKDVTSPDGTKRDIVSVQGFGRSTGWPIWSKDPRGYVTQTFYDSLGRVVKTIKPDDNDDPAWDPRNGSAGFRSDNPVQQITYNDTALWTRVTSPLGNVATYDYDNLGRLVKIDKEKRSRDLLGNPNSGAVEHVVTTVGYNPWGEITAITDPRGFTTNYQYDAMGRNKAVIYPLEEGVRSTKQKLFNYYTNLETVTDERGNISYLAYDMNGRLIKSSKLLIGDTVDTYTYYDGIGNQVAALDGNGNKVVTTYNALNLQDKVLIPEQEYFEGGKLTTFRVSTQNIYNPAGEKIAEILKGPSGEYRIDFELDGLGRAIRVKKPYTEEGTAKLAVEEIYYDEAGNKVKLVDAHNTPLPLAEQKATRYVYSARNQLLSETDTAGNKNSYTYDLEDKKSGMRDARGNSGNYQGDFSIVYHYDDLNRLVAAQLPAYPAGTQKPVVALKYDARGNLLERTEPDGGKTLYSYTARNKVKSETKQGVRKDGIALSYTTTHFYDEAGNEIKTRDNSGAETLMGYDRINRLKFIEYPEGNNEQYQYDKNSNKISVTDGNGHTSSFAYDPQNRLIKTVDAKGSVTSQWYDSRGNMSRLQDAKGDIRLYSFDELNRMTEEQDPLGYTTHFRYDEVGNILSKLDANGTEALYQYTDNYLLSQVTLNNSAQNRTESVAYLYDEIGDLMRVGNGQVATLYNTDQAGFYTPDPYSRIHTISKALDGKEYQYSYDYDVMGRITAVTYPTGKTVSYTYNNLGQLEKVPGYIDEPVTYNDNGLLESYQGAGNIFREVLYDQNNRLTNLSYTRDLDQIKSYVLQYDGANNIIKKNYSSYIYDEVNQLTFADLNGKFEVDVNKKQQKVGKLAEDYGAEGELAFDGSELELKLDYAAMSLGVDLEGSYSVNRVEINPLDAGHRIFAQSLELYVADSNWQGAYTKVEGWQLKTEEDGKIKILLAKPVTARYVKVHCFFDDRNGENQPVDASTVRNSKDKILKVFYMLDWRKEAYTYDELGNRLTSSVTLENMEQSTYTLWPHSQRIKSDGKYGYVYDPVGNLIEKGDHFQDLGDSLAFDTSQGEYWRYSYDLFNRLIKVEKADPATGQLEEVASYVYDADGYRLKKQSLKHGTSYYIFSLHGVLLYEENLQPGNYSEYIYVFSSHFAKVEGKIGGDGSERKTYFYVTDHLGSTVMVTDGAGTVLWQDELTPFGQSSGAVGVMEDSAKYTGKDLDQDTGLYYFNARWYSPDTGRFITEDPAKDGNNWYVYAVNNPLVFVDPTGLEAEDDVGNGITYREQRDDFVDAAGAAVDVSNQEVENEIMDRNVEQRLSENGLLGTESEDNMREYYSNVWEATYLNKYQKIRDDLPQVDAENTRSYKLTVGLRGAIVLGASFEMGVTWDTAGAYGLIFSGGVGVGLEVSAGATGNTIKALAKQSTGQSAGESPGPIMRQNSYSTEAKVALGVGISQDLNSKQINGIEIGSVGGGVYYTTSLVIPIVKPYKE